MPPSRGQQTQQPQQQQTAPDNRGSYDQPFIVKQIPRDPSEYERQQNEEKSKVDRELVNYTTKLATYTWYLFVATCGVVTVTAGLWIFTALMWLSTRQAIKDEKAALTVAQDNAKAARDGADAALKQTEHLASQTDTMKAMQRAFLAVDSIGIENTFEFPIIAKTRITNTGNIAATGVRWIVYAAIDPDFRRRKFCIHNDAIQWSNNIIAPRTPMIRYTNISTDYGIKSEHFEVVRAHRGAFYVWGIIYYFDGISSTERWTRFCHRYESDSIIVGLADITNERVRQHQFGNGTDEYPQRDEA